MARPARNLLVVALAPFVAACDGPQSALVPAGRDAESIAQLFWWMAGGAIVVWLFVMALAVYAIFSRRAHDPRRVQMLVIGGGALVPFIILSGLLVSGLQMMPALLDDGPDDALRIHVTGHQWWWRVTYEMPDGSRFDLANEIRIAPGRRTPLLLESADVIHSLWVPSLAGKVDLIPGRVNRMAIEPTRTGVFRGVCAEYCGTSHARMLIVVVVVPPAELDAWLEAQKAPCAALHVARLRRVSHRARHRGARRRRPRPHACRRPPRHRRGRPPERRHGLRDLAP
jgi:cytochrome c oxidase subunit II